MKIAEMQKICNETQHKNGCINCPLWNKEVPGGCLKNHKYDTSLAYQQAKVENNNELAERIQKDYEELERKVLNK